MKLAHSLLQALRAHGAQQIFGIPGDFALPFFKVIEVMVAWAGMYRVTGPAAPLAVVLSLNVVTS